MTSLNEVTHIWIVQAWVKNSPNVVPMGQAEFRSPSLAGDTAKCWRKLGFRVECFTREDWRA